MRNDRMGYRASKTTYQTCPNSVANFKCPRNPISTIDIEACEGQQLLKLDREFDDQATILWSLLDQNGRQDFVRAQNAWLTYRDQECNARARAYLGGTAAPVTFGQYETELTSTRVKEVSLTLTYYCQGRVRIGPARLCPRR
jgi:uncharacterized protein YecT (DUF1311 family)